MGFDAEKGNLTIGVIGTGTMGRGIMQIAAIGGLGVRAFDARPGGAVEAVAHIGDMLRRSVERGKLGAVEANEAMRRIEVVDGLEGFRGCDLVIEVIVEQLSAKRELFGQLDALFGPDTILATNTSSFSITEIAAACRLPDRVAGFHFFNPVPLMALVEVIPGVKTAGWVVDALMTVGRRMGRNPVVAADSPGFLVNHIGRAYMPEALRVLAEGVAEPADVDQIMRGAAGFRMGPFELLDLVGADVAHPVMESIYGQYYHEPMYQPSPLLRRRLAGGMLGRKTKKGFYEYVDGKASVSPGARTGSTDEAHAVWISRRDAQGAEVVGQVLKGLGVAVEAGERPSSEALCIVTPLGEDTTTAAEADRLDYERTIAVDTLFPMERHRTLMATPVTSAECRDAALGIFGKDGVTTSMINDSPGFVAQRIVAMVVNVGCNIAQQRVASPEDIDKAAKLGLNYPEGPLELGDRIGPRRILRILDSLHRFYGEPRYRAMPWLKRRAVIGVSLLTPDATS
jgi:3-hydroxybutyryl-CoA dehydrogenase